MLGKNTNLKVGTTLLIAIFFCMQLVAAKWDVPTDKKAINSNIKFDAAATKDGEGIYTKNCQSCHGNLGKNNSLKSLNPIPPDLSSTGTQQLTDGELFYILNTGRMIMPSFKNVLSESDRWKVISYIRSFNKNYVQVVSKADASKSNLVKIKISFDPKNNKIEVVAKAYEKTGVIALKDAEVLLFAKRYFGKLQIDETMHTNNDGVAVFNFPKDLPGDKTGNVTLEVKVNDEKYGEIEYQNKLKIGIPTDKSSLTQKRAIWNVVQKAPIWIIALYTFGVFCFGLIILYILYNLRKLFKSGIN